MAESPRTQIEFLSVPRLIIGTKWLIGWSHTSAAQDKLIREFQTREVIDISLKPWEHRASGVALQTTRSKASVSSPDAD
ncbi:MAG: hypothetical protein ACP5JG_06860 [Anaerolineae bacterium]